MVEYLTLEPQKLRKEANEIGKGQRIPSKHRTLRRWPAEVFSPQILWPQARRYAACVWWLFRDGASFARMRIVLVVLTSFIGVSSAAGSYFFVVAYAESMQSTQSKEIVFRGVHVPGLDGEAGVLAVAAAVFVLGVIGTGCIYYSAWEIQRITRRYEKTCSNRVLRLVGDPGRSQWRQTLLSSRVDRELNQLVNPCSRYTAFAFRSILEAILPLWTFLFALGYIIWSNWLLSSLLIPFAAIYLAGFYLINRQIAYYHEQFREMSKDVPPRLTKTALRLAEDTPPADAADLWSKAVLESSDYRHLADCCYGRIMAKERVTSLNGAFFVVCMTALLLYFGMQAPSGGYSWMGLVVFLVALRFVWTSLRQVTSLITNVSRFLPEFRYYSSFVRGAEADAFSKRTLPAPRGFSVSAKGHLNHERLTVEQGMVYLLLTEIPFKGYTLFRMAKTLFAEEAGAIDPAWHVWLQGTPMYMPWLSPLQNAFGSEPTTAERLRFDEMMKRLGVKDEVDSLIQSPQADCSDLSHTLSDEALYALCAARCFIRPRPITLLQYVPLSKLDGEFQARLLDELPDSATILIDTRGGRLLRKEHAPVRRRVRGVIVMGEDRVVGCGNVTWMQENMDVIHAPVSIEEEALPEGADDDLMFEE